MGNQKNIPWLKIWGYCFIHASWKNLCLDCLDFCPFLGPLKVNNCPLMSFESYGSPLQLLHLSLKRCKDIFNSLGGTHEPCVLTLFSTHPIFSKRKECGYFEGCRDKIIYFYCLWNWYHLKVSLGPAVILNIWNGIVELGRTVKMTYLLMGFFLNTI